MRKMQNDNNSDILVEKEYELLKHLYILIDLLEEILNLNLKIY